MSIGVVTDDDRVKDSDRGQQIAIAREALGERFERNPPVVLVSAPERRRTLAAQNVRPALLDIRRGPRNARFVAVPGK